MSPLSSTLASRSSSPLSACWVWAGSSCWSGCGSSSGELSSPGGGRSSVASSATLGAVPAPEESGCEPGAGGGGGGRGVAVDATGVAASDLRPAAAPVTASASRAAASPAAASAATPAAAGAAATAAAATRAPAAGMRLLTSRMPASALASRTRKSSSALDVGTGAGACSAAACSSASVGSRLGVEVVALSCSGARADGERLDGAPGRLLRALLPLAALDGDAFSTLSLGLGAIVEKVKIGDQTFRPARRADRSAQREPRTRTHPQPHPLSNVQYCKGTPQR